MPTNDHPYLCLNCIGETGVKGAGFRSNKPVCPRCGVDARNPELASFVVRCVETHFEPPHPVLRNRGTRKRLCDGELIFKNQDTNRATGDPREVSCPACLAHASFPKVDGELTVPAEADFQV